MKTKLLLIALVAGFTFTSCEKCKDCELKYEFINDDELVEITPKNIRLRKKLLKEHERKRASREGDARLAV